MMLGGVLLLGVPIHSAESASAGPDTHLPVASIGPTLHLNCGEVEARGNPVADFMYFVPLISPEPVTVRQSSGNTQSVRMLKTSKRVTANSFVVNCELECAGQGSQQYVFDHSEKIRVNEQLLKNGGLLDHQLASITVDGTGSIAVEVEGIMVGMKPIINEVRLRFSGRGHQSPVTILLYDIRYSGGVVREFNHTVASVNTLTFRRQPGPKKMEITVGAVHKREAGDSTWENLKGKVKAAAVNLVLDPIDVDPAGHDAMLKFGLALALETPAFTFPHARNLRP
jgi:hypothetical protein